MKLELILLTSLIFAACSNLDYNPEEKNVELRYQTIEYEIVIQPVVKDKYGVRIVYEF